MLLRAAQAYHGGCRLSSAARGARPRRFSRSPRGEHLGYNARMQIRYQTDERVFLQRVAGIAVRRGRLLLHKEAGAPYWSLPGGKSLFGESSPATLRRAMRDETGAEVEVGTLLFVVENLFRELDLVHEVGFYYRMELPADFPAEGPLAEFEEAEPDRRLVFRWFDRKELADVPFYPTFFRDALLRLPSRTVHVVHRDHTVDPAEAPRFGV